MWPPLQLLFLFAVQNKKAFKNAVQFRMIFIYIGFLWANHCQPDERTFMAALGLAVSKLGAFHRKCK
jgi:hypothetical protein